MRKSIGLTVAAVALLSVITVFWVQRGGSSGLPAVAIATLMSHPSLDAIEVGLREELGAGYDWHFFCSW